MSKRIILFFLGIIIIVTVLFLALLKSSKQEKTESSSLTLISNQELNKLIFSNPLSKEKIFNNEDIEVLVENQIVDKNESKWLLDLNKLLTVTE